MRTLGIIAFGGAIGALVRLSVNESIPRASGGFPWATLVVNVVGCLAIGWAAGRWLRTSDRWHLWVTGLLGGLTTMSTFAVETRDLLSDGHTGTAFVYVVVSLVAGMVALELTKASGPIR